MTIPCLKDLRGIPHFPWCSAFKRLFDQEYLQLQLLLRKLNSLGSQNLEQHHCSPAPEVMRIHAKHGRIILASPDGEQIHAPFINAHLTQICFSAGSAYLLLECSED